MKNILGKKMQKAVIWALGRPVVLLFVVLGGGAARSKKFQKGFKIRHFSCFAYKNRIETFGNAKETIVNLTTHYFIYFCSVLRNKSVSETANKPSYTLLI